MPSCGKGAWITTPSTNGHSSGAFEEARAERKRLRAQLREQVEILKLKQEKTLLESLQTSWEWSQETDQWLRLRAIQNQTDVGALVPPTMPTDRAHGSQWPLWRTEQELHIYRAQSRATATTNAFAIGLLDNLINYLLGKGGSYKSASKELIDADPEKAGVQDPKSVKWLVRQLQDWVDLFLRKNRWNATMPGDDVQVFGETREREVVRRHFADGEVFLRFFLERDGCPTVRFIEPECVRNPPGGTWQNGWSFGIQHQVYPREDVEVVTAYCVYYASPEGHADQYEIVPADEVIHLRGPRTPSTVKRGLPIFIYELGKALERASKLQDYLSISSAIRAATAEIWKHSTATLAGVTSMASRLAERQVTNPQTGQLENVERIRPGTIRRIPDGQEPVTPPTSQGTAEHMEVLQGDLQQAASGACMPKFFIGDTSGGNYSNLESASAPAVKAGEANQEFFRSAFGAVVRKAVRMGYEAGRLPREALTLVEVQVELPQVLHRNSLEVTQEDKILVSELKIKSPQTAAMERGLDPEIEAANIREWAEKTGQGQQQQQEPPQPGREEQPPEQQPTQESVQTLTEAKDSSGHEHKGKGKGGGQFVAKGKGDDGGKKEPTAKKTKEPTPKQAAAAKAKAEKATAKEAHTAAKSDHATAKKEHQAAKKEHTAHEKEHKAADRLRVKHEEKLGKSTEKYQAALDAHEKIEKKLAGKLATGKLTAAEKKSHAASKARLDKATAAHEAVRQAHEDAMTLHQGAQERLKGSQAKLDQAEAKVAEHAESVKRTKERFSGKDSLGREWSNGKLVAKAQKPTPEPDPAKPVETPKQPVTAQSLGLKTGASVTHPEYGHCEITNIRPDGTIDIEDENQDLHRRVNPAELDMDKTAYNNAAYQAEKEKAAAAYDAKQLVVRANKSLHEHSRPPLQEHEKTAVREYARDAFRGVNAALRSDGQLSEKDQAVHEGLKTAFAKTQPFDKPVEVRRGMRLDEQTARDFAAKAMAAQESGKPLTIKGYTSTTTDNDLRDSFKGNIHVVISARQGLDVSPYAALDEHELLLDNNSKFRVKQVQSENGQHTIHLEQILPGDEPSTPPTTSLLTPTGTTGTSGKTTSKHPPQASPTVAAQQAGKPSEPAPAPQATAPTRRETVEHSGVHVPVYRDSDAKDLPNEQQLLKDYAEAEALARKQKYGVPDLQHIMRTLKQKHPELSDEDIHRQMVSWTKKDLLTPGFGGDSMQWEPEKFHDRMVLHGPNGHHLVAMTSLTQKGKAAMATTPTAPTNPHLATLATIKTRADALEPGADHSHIEREVADSVKHLDRAGMIQLAREVAPAQKPKTRQDALGVVQRHVLQRKIARDSIQY